MKNITRIKKEIEAIGLRVEINDRGLNIYPRALGDGGVDGTIWFDQLLKLIPIMQKSNAFYRINFDRGYVRLH